MINKILITSFLSHLILLFSPLLAQETPRIPIGMNVSSTDYSSSSLIFNDVMKTASEWLTFNVISGGEWNTNKQQSLQLDPQGYPLEVPVQVKDSEPQGVRFLINDWYKGRYVLEYDGEGKFRFSVPNVYENGKTILLLDGKGENRWIDILESKKGNHIRNIRILPEGQQKNGDSPFFPLFVEGLKPFNCLRFMDWMGTNNSIQTNWESRSKPDYYSQGLNKGVAIEYAIELCNFLKCDAWFCVPHKVDDDYITQFAELVKAKLNPSLKIFLEFSNEVWNWQFQQSHYVLENAPGHPNAYVSEALKAISPKTENHPEKDAFMMQRVFEIWSRVFGTDAKGRLVRVATGQHAWYDNTRRILQYLFKQDQEGKPATDELDSSSAGAGCDAISTAAYFGYTAEDHQKWVAMDPAQVTPEMILEAVDKNMDNDTAFKETAKYARSWKVDYVNYEGGQHIQPFEQKNWEYNHAIYDAQINPRIYDLYMKLFRQLTSPDINSQLFSAFSYVSQRKVQWGSWGHLESLYQLEDLPNIKIIAPKYSALLDANLSPQLAKKLINKIEPKVLESTQMISLPNKSPIKSNK